jgi:hypothetical protein
MMIECFRYCRVPSDVERQCREAVRGIIDNKAKRVINGCASVISSEEPKCNTDLDNVNSRRIKDLYESISFPCGCGIENNLLKRGKGSKCKLNKEEHLINH